MSACPEHGGRICQFILEQFNIPYYSPWKTTADFLVRPFVEAPLNILSGTRMLRPLPALPWTIARCSQAIFSSPCLAVPVDGHAFIPAAINRGLPQ